MGTACTACPVAQCRAAHPSTPLHEQSPVTLKIHCGPPFSHPQACCSSTLQPAGRVSILSAAQKCSPTVLVVLNVLLPLRLFRAAGCLGLNNAEVLVELLPLQAVRFVRPEILSCVHPISSAANSAKSATSRPGQLYPPASDYTGIVGTFGPSQAPSDPKIENYTGSSRICGIFCQP